MKIRVSDYIANFLAERGIVDVFTVTGGGAMHLNDAFGNHKKLHCTYNHHEQACAIAAESYARLSGTIALVCVTSGPGGTNAMTGVLGGWLDSIPMLIISGQVKFSTTIKSTTIPLRQLGDQEFNITDSVRFMTKYSEMIINPEMILYNLEKALYLATHGRSGPVWLDIPLNVQGATIETDDLVKYDPEENKAELPPELDTQLITIIMQKIRNAKCPVVLAGGGIRLSGGYETFLNLIDALGIPVVTAWNSHDLIPDDHALYAGRPGTLGTRGGNFVVQNSDLVLSLGCRMNIRQISYNWENFAKNAILIAVDIDKNELTKPTLSIDIPVQADVKVFMNKLLDEANKTPLVFNSKWLQWCKSINAKYPADLPKYYSVNTPVNPYVFMKKLSEHLSENEVTVTGNGSACVCSFQTMQIKKHQRLYTNSGCASMGYGLPAALGAAIALKGKRVICLDGDGSIQMNIQELQTIAHNKLNIKIFWLNNDGYHSIRQTQKNIFNSRFCGINESSGISFPSAERIATAYNLKFVRIDSIDTMDKRIREVLDGDIPVLCEVILDPSQNFEPKLSSKALPDGTMVSASLEDMFPFLSDEEMESNKYSKD